MPSEIESRIVSMIFDNKQFEKNVATSQKTLEKLDEQLKFKDADKGFKGISDAASQVSFSSMISKVQDIGIKMKASSVIGIEVLKRLTNSAIDFAKTWASKVIEPITSGGWNRATAIDNAKFQLQGLGIAWDEISDDIDYGVKDTAYGLGAAAMAAAQFAASGVQLGDNMKTALRGISGVAAMTNSTYEDISRIFTGIAGANRVYGDDLNSLAARGLNAAAVLANALNTTEANVREMVSKGQIDFATFSKAMDDAYGEHAKKGNETFEGSLANMKSALGRIGAEFASSYRAQMIPVWNALRITINDVKKTMGPVFETADAIMTDLSERFSSFIYTIDELVVKSGAFASIFEGVADIMEGIYEVGTSIIDIFKNAASAAAPLVDGLLEINDNFSDAKMFTAQAFVGPAQKFAEMARKFKELIQSDEFIDKLIAGVRSILSIASAIKSIFGSIISTVKGMISSIIDGVKNGINPAGVKLLTIQQILNFISRIVYSIKNFLESASWLQPIERVRSILYTIGTAIGTLWASIKGIASAASEAWSKIFPFKQYNKDASSLGARFNAITVAIRTAFDTLKLRAGDVETLKKHFEGVFNVLKVGKRVFNVIGQVLGVMVANILNLAAVAKQAFFKIFDGSKPSDFAKRLNILITTIQNFIQRLLFSEKALDNFRKFFEGIFSVFAIGKDIVTALFHVFQSVFTNIMGGVTRNTDKAIDGISGLFGWIGALLTRFREWTVEHDIFNRAATVMATIIAKTINFIRNFAEWCKIAAQAFDSWVTKVTGSSIKEHFNKIGDAVQNAWGKVKEFFQNLSGGREVDDGTEKINRFSGIWEKLKFLFDKIVEFAKAAMPVISSVFGSLLSMLSSVFGGLTDIIGQMDLGNTAGNVGGLLAGIGALKLGSGGKGMLDSIKGMFSGLTDAIGQFQEKLKADTLRSLAVSILMIAGSVMALALVDSGKLMIALGSFYGLTQILQEFITQLTSLASDMGKSGVKDFKKVSQALISLGAALLIISLAVSVLARIDPMDLIKGLGGLFVIILELEYALKNMSDNSKGIGKAAASMILMATALTIMVIPMKAFANMEWEEIAKGLVAVGALLLEFVLAVRLLDGGSALAAASTVIILSTAMLMLTVPMAVFAKLEWEEIAKGLVAVGGLLLEFVIVTKLIKGGSALAAAVTVTILATSLIMLIAPMEAFGRMDWMQIAKGLVAVAGLMLEFVIVTKLLKGSSALAAAATVMGLAIALNFLIVPLKAFGSMSWAEIGKGLLVIAGALGAFVLAGYLAAPVIGVIMGLSVALVLLGAAALAVGTGILNMALGLQIMTGIGPEIGETIKAVLKAVISMIPAFIGAIMLGLAELVAGIFGIIDVIVIGVFTMIPRIITGIIGMLTGILNAVLEFLPTLLEAFPIIVDAFFSMLTTLLTTLAAYAPEMFAALTVIVEQLFIFLYNITPEFFAWVGQVLLGIIQVIRDTAPALIETVFEIILKLLEELAKNAADITELVITTIVTIIETLTTRLPEITLKVVEFVIGLINSVADTLMEKAPEIRDAIAKLLGSIIKLTLEIFGFDTSNMDENEFTNIGKFLMGGFVGGIAKKFPEFWEKIKEFFKSIGEWFKQKFEDFKDWGKNIIESFVKGVKEKFENAKEKVTGFFSKIGNGVKDFFGIHSPSKMFSGFGQNVMEGFKNGVGDKLTTVTQKMSSVFKDVVAAVGDPQSSFSSIGANLMAGLQNGINSNVQNAINAVKGAVSSVIQGAKNLLGIRSPSRVFAEIGKYCDQGMAKGLNSYSDLVAMAGEDVANEAIMSTAKAMAMASEMATDATNQPTIRPVLDLTEIENGTSRIANMFGDPTLGLGTTGGYTYTDWSLGQIKMGSPTGTSEGSGSSIITNSPVVNFTINAAQGQNPEEIAAAVEKRLTKSFNQKGAAFR